MVADIKAGNPVLPADVLDVPLSHSLAHRTRWLSAWSFLVRPGRCTR
jgi:hypothetical protein